MEQDHANFIEEYAEMTQAFMTDQEAQWNKWFKEKQTELSGDIAGKLQLQIDDVKEKVYNIAFKVYIISTLEQITSPVTVKLTNKTMDHADGYSYKKPNGLLCHGSRRIHRGSGFGKRYGYTESL